VGVKLSDLGEFGFIDRLRDWLPAGDAIVGVGDDAAVVRMRDGGDLVASSDALIEGVHFRLDWSTASDVGFKAVSVNVSDLAAMGAEPRFLLVVLAAPASIEDDVLAGLYGGMAEACALYGTEVIGGDTVRAPEGSGLGLTVTALGQIDGAPLRRSGARPGDVLAVTGALGRAAAGVNLLLSGDPRDVVPEDGLACLDAHRRPVARVKEGQRLKDAGAHAAIDISDGLASDVRRIAEASGVGVEIDLSDRAMAPEARNVAAARGWDIRQIVLGGGEDLELLVAVPPSEVDALGLIEVGRVVSDGVWLVRDGERTELDPLGYDHFKRS
jgi:thiamine-monophosphate kinase